MGRWLYLGTLHRQTAFILCAIAIMASTVGCNVDSTMKGEFGLVDDEVPTIEILSPTATDEITWWNQKAFQVSGTCFLKGRVVKITASGAQADDASCQQDGTWVGYLDFTDPGVADGKVVISARYRDLPTVVKQDSVEVSKLTYPKLFLNDAASVAEGSNLIFQVTFDHESEEELSFEWSTVDGTATASDSDYTSTTARRVTVGAGIDSYNITIPTTHDLFYEADEDLEVNLLNATLSYINVDSASATISNNDLAPNIYVYDASASEGSAMNFVISIDALSKIDASFNYSTFPGTATALSDYTPVGSSAVIPAGSQTVSVSVSALDDSLYEADETFVFTLSGVVHANVLVGGTDNVATGTVTNTDAMPNLFIGDVSVAEGSSLVFSVTMDRQSTVNSIFNWQTFDGTATTADSDYTAVASTTMTISPSSWGGAVTVVTGNDSTLELDETLVVSLTPVAAVAVVNSGVDNVAVGTILNNDAAPLLFIDDLVGVSAFDEGQSQTFSVSLSQTSTLDAIFSWQTYDGTATSGTSDYTSVSSTQVTIPAGSLTTGAIAVSALSDSIDENQEFFTITLAVVSGAVAGDLSAVGSINDMNSPPNIYVGDVTAAEGETLSFIVSLDVVSGLDVNFNYQSFDVTALLSDSDYTAISGVATIPALSGQVTLNVTSIEDLIYEADETMLVSLSSVNNANIAVSGTDDMGTGTISNDDGQPILFLTGSTATEGSNLVFVASISAVSGIDVTFNFQSYNGNSGTSTLNAATADSDYTGASGLVTISSTNLFRNITIATGNDTKYESDEIMLVSLYNASGATIVNVGVDNLSTGTISNDDSAPFLFIDDLSFNEGSTGSHVVSLSQVSGLESVFSFVVSNNETVSGDYTAITNATVTIAAGITTSSVDILATADGLDEPVETYDVSLASVSGVQVGDLEAVGSITDMDAAPALYIDDLSFIEGTTGTATISLSAVSGRNVTFQYQSFDTGSASSSTDYTAIGLMTATISAGSSVYNFNLISTDDATLESDETFAVSLLNLVNATFGDSSGTMTIQNDDGAPQIRVYPVTGNEGETLNFTASLSSSSGIDIDFDWLTYDVSATGGSDYTAVSSTNVTISAGLMTIALPVITATDAPLDENNETFLVSLSNATNGILVIASALGTITDLDSEPFIYASDATAVNEGETLGFSVSLSKISGRDVVVNWETLAGTATSGTDYNAVSTTAVTLTAGTTVLPLDVVALTDVLNEPTENLSISLSSATNGIITISTGSGDITDINPDPFLFITDAPTVTEGETANFTVSLSAVSAVPVVFSWTSLSGTATAPADYTTASGTVTIAAMTSNLTLSVASTDDLIDEVTENFYVTLSAISDAQIGDVLGQVQITDNDAAPTIFSADAAAVTEGETAVFTFSLSAVSGLDVSFDFQTTDDTAVQPGDYSAIALTTVTIPAGSLTLVRNVVTIDDSLDDSSNSEYFNVTLTSPNNATIAVANALGEIIDNDNPPTIYVSDESGNEGATLPFLVSLSGASENDIDFDIQTVDGTAFANGDYGAATISGGQISAGSTTFYFVVITNSDGLYEATENFLVTITSTNATSSGSDFNGIGTITNTNPAPTIFIDDFALTEPDTVNFTVSLSAVSGIDVWFNYASVDTGDATGGGIDYTDFSATMVTISAGTSAVTVSGANAVDDLIAEGVESYQITLTAINNADDGKNGATVTINDNEATPYLSVFDDSQLEGSALSFIVSLSGSSSGAVSFDFQSYDLTALSASDYTSTSTTQTIAAGARQVTISVNTGNDSLYENNETFAVTISNPIGSATIADNSATGTIQNNDTAPILFIDDLSFTEEETGYFSVSLNVASALDVVFSWQTFGNLTATEGTDYTATSGQGTISAGGVGFTIPVVALPLDLLDEPSETFALNLTIVSGADLDAGDLEAVGTIVDNDGAPNLFVDDIVISEGESAFTRISLSAASGLDIDFDFQTYDSTAIQPTDYTPIASTRLTIAAGAVTTGLWVVTQEDTVYEGNQSFIISLANITNANGGDTDATATIADDDAMPTLVIYDSSLFEGDNLGFMVSMNAASEVESSFDWVFYDGLGVATLSAARTSDYTSAATGSQTLASGVTSFTISVPTVADTVFEFDEQFHVSITSTTNVSIAVPGTDDMAVGTIQNDDSVPLIFISDASLNEGQTSSVVVSLSAVSGLDTLFNWDTYDGLPVTLSAQGGSDYTGTSSQTATIPAGSLSASLTVDAWADLIDEYDENYIITLSGLVLANPGDIEGVVTVIDQTASPNLFVDDLDFSEGTTGSMTVSLDAASGRDIYFTYQSFDNTATSGSDYTAISATVLTIAAGLTSANLSLVSPDDAVAEGNETFFVSLTAASGANLTDDTAIATIIDDDVATLTIFDALTVNEGEALQFVVSISTITASNVTFDWTTVDNSAVSVKSGHPTGDYTQVSPQSALISAGSSVVTLSVVSIDDDFVEGTESLFVSLSNLSSNASTSDYVGQGAITSPDVHSPNVRLVADVRSGVDFEIATSADGYEWKFADLSDTYSGAPSYYMGHYPAAYCKGYWYVRTNSANLIQTADFSTYTNIDLSSVGATAGNIFCFDDVVFAQVKSGGSFDIIRSTDGTNWTGITLDGSKKWQSMAINKNKIWATKTNTGILAYSEDLGATFSTITISSGTPYFDEIKADSGRIVTYPADNANEYIYYTDDDYLTVTSVTSSTGGTGVYGKATFIDGYFHVYYFNAGHNGFYTNDFVTFASGAAASTGSVYYEGGAIYGGPSGPLWYWRNRSVGDVVNLGPAPAVRANHIMLGGIDYDPGVFKFVDQDDVAISATLTSNPITISAALTSTIGVFASNGAEVAVNSGGFVDGWGAVSVTGGDVVEIRMAASSTIATEKTSTVRIGAKRDDWTIKTTETVDVYLSAASTAVTEGNTAFLTVSLNSIMASDVTFNFTTYDDTATAVSGDYQHYATAGTGTVPAGQSQVTLSVETFQDDRYEADETFSVTLSGASANATLVDNSFTVTISNDDAMPTLAIEYPFTNLQPVGYKMKVSGTCNDVNGSVNISVSGAGTGSTTSTCTSGAYEGYINTSSFDLGQIDISVEQPGATTATLSAQKTTAVCNDPGVRGALYGSGLAGGSGTKTDPFVVCTEDQMNSIRSAVAGDFFVFGNDMYFESGDSNGDFVANGSDTNYRSGTGWTSLPEAELGLIDGNGFTLSHFLINNAAATNSGFVNKRSRIVNLNFYRPHVLGGNSTGVVSGNSQYTSVARIRIVDAFVQGGNSVGGVFGELESRSALDSVRVSGTVRGVSDVGGILGGAFAGPSASNLVFEGSVYASEGDVGGIWGGGRNGILQQFRVNANVYSKNGRAGGAAGGTQNMLNGVVEGTVTSETNSAACIAAYAEGGGNYKDHLVALCDSVTGSSSSNDVGFVQGESFGTIGSSIYYTQSMTVTNTNGGGTTNTLSGTGVTDDATLMDLNHTAWDGFDFVGDSSDGLSGIWVNVPGEVPHLAIEENVVFTPSLSGSGTSSDPYLIQTATDLLEISSNPFYATATFSLTNSIDLSTVPEFNGLFHLIPFEGEFYGGGNTIFNVSLTESTTNYPVGFFGTTQIQSKIENVAFDVVTVSGGSGATGVVVGVAGGGTEVSKLNLFGNGISGNGTIGGAVGTSRSYGVYIKEIESHIDVMTDGYDGGGVVGSTATRGYIIDTYSTGNVTAYLSSGGVLGGGSTGSYGYSSYSTGSVSVASYGGNAGGVVGATYRFYDSFAIGDVTGSSPYNSIGLAFGKDYGTTNYYFSGATCTNSGTEDCNTFGSSYATLSDFYDESNAPMSTWDFTNVWQSNNPTGLPTLRRTAKTQGAGPNTSLNLFVSDAAANEGSPVYFTVYLDQPVAIARSVSYTTYAGTAGSSDFVSVSGTAVIGAKKQAAQIKVPTLQDAASEGNEIFYVSLSGASAFTNIIDDQAIGTIIDDDDSIPDLYVLDSFSLQADASLSVLVTLSSVPASDVVFTVNTADGTATGGADYTAISGLVVTMASGGSTTKTLAVTLSGVADGDPAEYFTVNLSAISGANAVDVSGIQTIVDDTFFGSASAVTLSGTSSQVNEGEVAELRFELVEATTSDINMMYVVYNGTATMGSDFISQKEHSYYSDSITIPAGQVTASIFFETIEDGILESDETFTISFAAMSQMVSITSGMVYTVTIANAPMPCPDEGWCQQSFIQPDKNVAGNYFGSNFDMAKDRLVVGAYSEDSDYTGPFTGVTTPSTTGADSNVGAAFVFERTGSSWAQTAYLKASNPDANDSFGSKIVADGDTVAVGVSGEDSNQTTITNGAGASSDNSVMNAGAVYVFVKSGATWEQQAYIKASNAGDTFDGFGTSLALDGDTLAVSAPSEDSGSTSIINGTGTDTSNTTSNSGAVYIYKRTGTTWAQEALIKSPESVASAFLGSHITLERDTLGVTSANMGPSSSGKLYLFSRTGSTWSYSTALVSPAPTSGDSFGANLQIQDQTLAIGVPEEDSASTTIINGTTTPPTDDGQSGAGAVYVYRKSGATWVQEAYLKPSVAIGGKFGNDVQLDGDILAINQKDSNSSFTGIINGTEVPELDVGHYGNGAVFVYKRSGSSWSQQAYIKPYVAPNARYFGSHLALEGDTLVASMDAFDYNYGGIINSAQLPQENYGANSGGALVFYRKGAPRVYIRPKSTQALTAASLPIEWDVTFSKEIVDATFTAGDISLGGASTGSGVTWNLINSGDNRHYTLQATVVSGSGTLIPVIDAGSVTDAQYNSNEASSPNIDSTVTYSP